jgi:membrane protein YdbS with pleckstrin-like domain
MDFENVWRQGGDSDDALNKLLNTDDFSKLQSKLPLVKLKRNLLIGIIWAVIITTFYITVFFFVDIWQGYVVLAVLIIFNIVIALDSSKLYNNINVNISTTNSLKEELQKNYTSFIRWWRIQERLSLFVYPIAAAGGFIIGGVWGSGKPVEVFLYNTRMLLILAVTILFLVPLCYYGARWMFNYAYGKHLKKLKLLIDELSKE